MTPDDLTSAARDALSALDAAAPPGGHGPRLFTHQDTSLAEASQVTLAPGQAHYLRTVLRRGTGDAVVLFNGRDGEWLARLSRLDRGAAEAVCETCLRPQSEAGSPGPWLLFAPLKRGPVDQLAEKATELGASRLVPVMTRRTTAARLNTTRLQAHAVEAAEQCRRLTVPEVVDAVPLDSLAATWPAERRLFVLAESGPAQAAAPAFVQAAGTPAALLVGPEGGFTDSELDGLRELPFVTPVRLGPRVLRAETAALAGLATWQAVAGDARMDAPD